MYKIKDKFGGKAKENGLLRDTRKRQSNSLKSLGQRQADRVLSLLILVLGKKLDERGRGEIL